MFDINQLMKNEYRPAEEKATNRLYILKLLKLIFKLILIQTFDLMVILLKYLKPSKPENISKKLALVTGGGNGLGRSICFRLAREGCDLAIADIDYKSACRTAIEIEEKFCVACRPYHCDISDKVAIYKLKNDIENEMREVDILVNNAGLLYMSDFLTADIDDIERTVQVNLLSQMMMTRIFVTGMIERKYGRIMAICSVTCIASCPALAVYTATKRGLDGFMKSFSDELLLSGNEEFIKTTIIYPDFMNTRQEFVTIFDKMKLFLPPRSPELVADDAVNGLRANKEFVYSTDNIFIYCTKQLLSKNARKLIIFTMLDASFMYQNKH